MTITCSRTSNNLVPFNGGAGVSYCKSQVSMYRALIHEFLIPLNHCRGNKHVLAIPIDYHPSTVSIRGGSLVG